MRGRPVCSDLSVRCVLIGRHRCARWWRCPCCIPRSSSSWASTLPKACCATAPPGRARPSWCGQLHLSPPSRSFLSRRRLRTARLKIRQFHTPGQGCGLARSIFSVPWNSDQFERVLLAPHVRGLVRGRDLERRHTDPAAACCEARGSSSILQGSLNTGVLDAHSNTANAIVGRGVDADETKSCLVLACYFWGAEASKTLGMLGLLVASAELTESVLGVDSVPCVTRELCTQQACRSIPPHPHAMLR